MSPGKFSSKMAFEKSYDFRSKHHKKGPLSARKKNKLVFENERDRSARLAADRNYGKKKFASKIPEKALRSTFNIDKEMLHPQAMFEALNSGGGAIYG